MEVRYQTDAPPNAKKRINLLFLHDSGLKIFCLLKDLCYGYSQLSCVQLSLLLLLEV